MDSPNNMTEPKRWPNEAEWARIDSVASAIQARKYVKLALQHVVDLEAIRNLFEAIECMHEIETKLNLCRNGSDKESNKLIYRVNGKIVEGEEK